MRLTPKNNSFLLIIILFCTTAYAQHRQTLQGMVITDSLKAESVTVKNLTSGGVAITNNNAEFKITAKAGDTLFFTGMPIRDMSLVLKKKDFEEEIFVVKANINVMMLDEVVVHNLTGNLAIDSKLSKVTVYRPEFDAKEINKDIIAGGGAANGINFIAVGKMLFKNKSTSPAEDTYVPDKIFRVKVRELYNDNFFTETLKIDKESIPGFLQYCATPVADILLKPENELQLIAYLTNKSAEYLRLQQLPQDKNR